MNRKLGRGRAACQHGAMIRCLRFGHFLSAGSPTGSIEMVVVFAGFICSYPGDARIAFGPAFRCREIAIFPYKVNVPDACADARGGAGEVIVSTVAAPRSVDAARSHGSALTLRRFLGV